MTYITYRGWGPVQGCRNETRNPGLLNRAPDVLQDMAITIAEAVATAYLAEASCGLSGNTISSIAQYCRPPSADIFSICNASLIHTAFASFVNIVVYMQGTKNKPQLNIM